MRRGAVSLLLAEMDSSPLQHHEVDLERRATDQLAAALFGSRYDSTRDFGAHDLKTRTRGSWIFPEEAAPQRVRQCFKKMHSKYNRRWSNAVTWLRHACK